jgi:two-component system, sensor histidine kinase ChiS
MDKQELGWAGAVATTVALLASGGAPGWSQALAGGGIAMLAFQLLRRTSQQHATAAGKAELQAALRRRDEQLAHTVHELRTPLASVVTALEMLREGYASTPDEIDEFLDQASLSARHMGFLVNDVLDEAALAAGQLRLHRQALQVHDLLSAAREVLCLQARSRGIDLRFAPADHNLAVYTDERRFLQIMFNLVGNALKFTAAGETVNVHAESHDEHVRFVVADHGAGVPQEARDKLFLPFGSAPMKSGQAVPGTGLGLHVCRLLVEQLGGLIGYEPGATRGSVFWFEQPSASNEALPFDSTVAPMAVATR